MLSDLLFDPDGFFAERADDPGFRGPVVVALVTGAVGLGAALPSVRFTIAAMPPEARAFGSIALVVAAVGAFVGPFVRWLLFTVAFFAVATVAFDPDGSLRDLAALVGWGLVPGIPAGIVAALASYLVFSGATPPSDPEAIATFVRGLRSDPIIVVSGVVGLAFLAWSAMLWTFAVRHALSLSLRDALVTVAVPTAVAALWRINGLVGGFP